VVEGALVRGHEILLAGVDEAEAAHHLENRVVVPVRLLPVPLVAGEAAAARPLLRFLILAPWGGGGHVGGGDMDGGDERDGEEPEE